MLWSGQIPSTPTLTWSKAFRIVDTSDLGEGIGNPRGVVLLEWARMHRLAFASTHLYSRSDGATHTHWSTKVRSQIDFIMVPCSDIEHC